jgi:hypothetical protein
MAMSMAIIPQKKPALNISIFAAPSYPQISQRKRDHLRYVYRLDGGAAASTL